MYKGTHGTRAKRRVPPRVSCVSSLRASRIDRMRVDPRRKARTNLPTSGAFTAAPRREARRRRRPARARGSRRARLGACTRRRRPRSRRRPRGAPRGGGGRRILHLAVGVRRIGGAEAQVPHLAPRHDDQRAREEQQDLHAQQEPGRAVVVRVGEDPILFRWDESVVRVRESGKERERVREATRVRPREIASGLCRASRRNGGNSAACLGKIRGHVPLPDRFASPTG